MDKLDDARWRAVETRDHGQNGVFYYGVRTTGVFCRPGCSSRRPLRQNVDFFVSVSSALDAGYRACQRCQPERDAPIDSSLASVVALCRLLEDSSETVDISTFARQHGYSERHLRRRFRDIVGVPVDSYRRHLHASRARAKLTSSANVLDAAFEAGFGSSRAFYEHAATQLGMKPGRYRDGGRGEQIRYTSLESPIGTIVAARTDTGVCFVQLGDDEAPLVQRLRDEFPYAAIRRDDDGLIELARVLAGAVRGERDATSLPIDLEGTTFQIRVWDAVRRIPSGTTVTYSDVAREIGATSAVRAVASAIGSNPVALAVPCHRVLRKDGSLGGYRRGLAAKQSLLDAEASYALA